MVPGRSARLRARCHTGTVTTSGAAARPLRRVAMISVHTSPLDQPGTGDAGGMNVYVLETARRLAARGIEVEVFTRARSGSVPEVVDCGDGVLVRHVTAGPFEGLGKHDLPGQLCAMTAGVMRYAATRPEGWFDLVHTHYWLSGQVGWLSADRWNIPLVHTMHTMAKVKNLGLAGGDSPEPPGREIGEAQVVDAADLLLANTADEAGQLVDLYDADPDAVRIVRPGVDLDLFSPGSPAQRLQDRAELGLPPDAVVVLLVGRIQPLKGPHVLVRAAARLLRDHPDLELRDRLHVVILGGESGTGAGMSAGLRDLAEELGVAERVHILPPVDRERLAQWYRAVDVVTMPSSNESFGLVALEAQASGTPVVAARVGGLPIAVGDAGVLVDGHEDGPWADALARVLGADPAERERRRRAGVEHARGFGWEVTVDRLLEVYAEAVRRHAGASDAAVEDLTGDADPLLAGLPTAVVP